MILLESVKSLFLTFSQGGVDRNQGTGFIASGPHGLVLVTNWHNVTNQHVETKARLGPPPDTVRISHNATAPHGQAGVWVDVDEPLYDRSGNRLWIEHPTLKDNADVVALPLTKQQGIVCHPYTLGVGDPQIRIGPTDVVSVVGFPFGGPTGRMAVWATGFVASEPDLPTPAFLIDCRGRPGQSGSPVLAHRSGGMVAMENGNSSVFSGPVSRFLGIYSGRINDQSDLGIVWKAIVVQELVAAT